MGDPQNGWFIRENLTKMDDLPKILAVKHVDLLDLGFNFQPNIYYAYA